jgi:uncharacterized protein (UPF0303 family)
MTSPQDHTSGPDLLAEEETLRLEHVDELACHRIGSRIAERGLREGRSVAVVVYLGEWLVYKAMLPGTSLNNDVVIEGKRRVATIEGHSSLWARNRHLDAGTTFEEATGLAPPAWAPYGGAVPLVTTDGTRQGWVIVSGMTQEDDHAFAVTGIRAARAGQDPVGPPAIQPD